MSKYAKLVSTPVPQLEPFDSQQVKNNAGGFVWQLDCWDRLDRFLVLGSSSNTYYQTAQKLTRENAACVAECYAEDAARTVTRIAEISDEGRAPRNDAAIFALALGATNEKLEVRQEALSALPAVCRTSTHLFQFVDVCRALGRGWGRAFKRAIAGWYDARNPASVAFQVIKYRARENYTHKRLLETARPYAELNQDVYKWAKGKAHNAANLPEIIAAHEKAMGLKDDPKAVAKLVTEYRLPWEAVPTEVTKDPDVWRAMLPHLGLTALIRNLGALTSYGVLKPLEPEVPQVVELLSNEAALKKARVHPFQLLLALTAYRGGASISARRYGKKGLEWTPVPQVTTALEKAFYASFKYVQPTGKRILIGLDVSGSMSSAFMDSHLRVCEAAAALAMTTMRTEQNWYIHGFTDRFTELPLEAGMTLDRVLKHTENVNFGGTDCALPMLYALKHGLKVDVFQVITDNETWAGSEHPVAALKRYRQATGIPAKLIVVGMTSTGFSIADPNDPGMLDVVGFDAAAPAVMSEFMRG